MILDFNLYSFEGILLFLLAMCIPYMNRMYLTFVHLSKRVLMFSLSIT